MRIKDLLAYESIELNGAASGKTDVLNQMVNLMDKRGNISDIETYRKGVFEREEEGTTGVGEGIAIPHCKSDAVKTPGLAAMVLKNGVEYEALDGEPVHLIFLIAAPNTKDNVHLDVLSKLSTLLMDEEFTTRLKNASSKEEFLSIIDEAEHLKDEIKDKESEKGYQIVAVTACPTGIAHTYMAAESLEKKAKEMGYTIKVETKGSGGAKNVLTQEEIDGAVAVIVAADTKVPMDRFSGKPVIITKVADGINKAEDLLTRAMKGEAPIYKGEAKVEKEVSNHKRGMGHAFYTHLMSGVSHMLPFVIGGGIMIALAFLLDTIMGYGSSGGGNFGTCTPVSAFFKYVGGLTMGLMVPVLAGYIAYSIADRPGLAVGFTGGLLASSGNAAVTGFVWGSENLTGFQGFIAKFGFQQANGGATVSGFLGGILAGFLAGAIVLFLKKVFSKLPPALDGIKPTLIYPLLGVLIIGILMCFIFNPLIGLLNTGLSNMLSALADKNLLWLLGLLLGGMMAIDMGGPINKAAYVFGSGMLGTANELMAKGAEASDPKVQACFIIMAAIMVGGMVPPVGISLACFLFPGKFTKAERDSKISNLVMGASFITEGAIPFAAADPLRVIPCTFAGAAVAGLLSAIFKCTLMAPHGGVFVFATVGNPFFYILAWVIGSVVTALLLGVLKKKAE